MDDKWTIRSILIAVLMVGTGSINTLAAKWADFIESNGHLFNHPFVQAVAMFIGEFSCLFVYFLIQFIQGKRKTTQGKSSASAPDVVASAESGEPEVKTEEPPKLNWFVFLPPAMLDMCSTSIMYVGLNLTNAASFQMLRGAVIIFTGFLSVAFLRTVLRAYKWTGMVLVMCGLVIVGLGDVLRTKTDDFNGVISGDLLIIMAQIITAGQVVYEQKFVVKYNVDPLLAVGLEGFFGMTVLALLCIPFYFVHVPVPFGVPPAGRLEDALDAFQQIRHSGYLVLALMGTVVSIAFFNFAGISVTKDLSSTTRMILDSVRTVFIWVVSLGLGWQTFNYLQVIGFLVLFAGMSLYNNILIGPTNAKKLFGRHRWGQALCGWFYKVPELETEEDKRILVRNEEGISTVSG